MCEKMLLHSCAAEKGLQYDLCTYSLALENVVFIHLPVVATMKLKQSQVSWRHCVLLMPSKMKNLSPAASKTSVMHCRRSALNTFEYVKIQ